MGQKVNPHGLRVGVIKDWDSKWYAEESFEDYLKAEAKIRVSLKNGNSKKTVSKILYSCYMQIRKIFDLIVKKVKTNMILYRKRILS